MTLMDKAKKKIKAKEAEIKGKSWLSNVKTEDGAWKDLQGWKDHFEPKTVPTDQQIARQNKVKAKAMDVAMVKLEDGVSAELIKAILEITSTVLEKIIETISSHKDPAHDAIRRILKSIDIVVLSFRFETKSNKHQVAHIRQQACSELLDIVHPLITNSKDALQMLSKTLRQHFASQRDQMPSIVSSRVRLMIGQANAQLDERVDDKIAKTQATVKDHVAKAVGMGAPPAAGAHEERAKEDALATAAVVRQRKDEAVVQFASMLETMIVSRLMLLDEQISECMDRLLAQVEMAIGMYTFKGPSIVKNKKSPSSKEEAEEHMLATLKQQYKETKAHIKSEIGAMLSMMKAFVNDDDNDEDDEGS